MSVSIITPVAPYHLDRIDAVRATVAAQSVPCHHILVVDTDGRGPGVARNVGLKRADGDFVVFLDADDALEPDFIERCLNAYDGSHYIYTDWLKDGLPVAAPDCPWRKRTWHCITTLIPTVWAREVGGFDETTQAEDTDFYLKLTNSGFCGKRLAVPLFHYGKAGRRAEAFVHGPDFEATMQRLSERYGGKRTMANCGDCGDNVTVNAPPAGEQEAGDVLATALWAGNRRERGRSTGRLYARAGNGAKMWVAPEDIAATPHLWQRVRESLPVPVPVMQAKPRVAPTVDIIDTDEQPVTELQPLAQAMFPGTKAAPPQAVPPKAAKPNVSRVRNLAKGKRA